MSAVRFASEADLDAAVELVAGRNRAVLAALLRRPDVVFLIAEWGGSLTGFLIAQPADASTATIEDFCVETPALWPSVGQSLLRAARAALRERGVKQIVVTADDAEKQKLLAAEKFSLIANGWTALT